MSLSEETLLVSVARFIKCQFGYHEAGDTVIYFLVGKSEKVLVMAKVCKHCSCKFNYKSSHPMPKDFKLDEIAK